MLNEGQTTQLSQFLRSTAKYQMLCLAKAHKTKNAAYTLRNKMAGKSRLKIDKPRTKVDFNELVVNDLVLLSN